MESIIERNCRKDGFDICAEIARKIKSGKRHQVPA